MISKLSHITCKWWCCRDSTQLNHKFELCTENIFIRRWSSLNHVKKVIANIHKIVIIETWYIEYDTGMIKLVGCSIQDNITVYSLMKCLLLWHRYKLFAYLDICITLHHSAFKIRTLVKTCMDSNDCDLSFRWNDNKYSFLRLLYCLYYLDPGRSISAIQLFIIQ